MRRERRASYAHQANILIALFRNAHSVQQTAQHARPKKGQSSVTHVTLTTSYRVLHQDADWFAQRMLPSTMRHQTGACLAQRAPIGVKTIGIARDALQTAKTAKLTLIQEPLLVIHAITIGSQIRM